MRHDVERSKVVTEDREYLTGDGEHVTENRGVIGHGGGEKRGSGSYGLKVFIRVGNKV